MDRLLRVRSLWKLVVAINSGAARAYSDWSKALFASENLTYLHASCLVEASKSVIKTQGGDYRQACRDVEFGEGGSMLYKKTITRSKRTFT